MTGHTEDSYKVHGLNAGMNDILEKPLYIQKLKQILYDL